MNLIGASSVSVDQSGRDVGDQKDTSYPLLGPRECLVRPWITKGAHKYTNERTSAKTMAVFLADESTGADMIFMD